MNMMLAGWDKHDGPSLYYLDYISTLHKLEKGGMGYGERRFTTSLHLAFVLYIYLLSSFAPIFQYPS